jgi:C_GCAxxG_C_C family probable redox protein
MRISKEKVINKAHAQALIRTPQCHSCSRGTLLALMDAFNIKNESVFKAVSGFHGGIGGKRDVCGSLLGASAMIGLVCGSPLADIGKAAQQPGPGEMDRATQLVAELYDKFRREFRSVQCRTIRARFEKEVSGDPTSEDLPEEKRMGQIFAKCDALTARTAAMTAEMLWEATGL